MNKHNMHVIGGNQRLEALKELGYEEVEVHLLNIKDSNEEKALNIALNKIHGDWDQPKLLSILEEMELEHFDVTLTGFDKLELKELSTINLNKKEIEEDNFNPENVESTVQLGELGEVWQLGKHRLMCGDATKKEDVKQLVDGQKVDMVFTDPPYEFEDNSYFKLIVENSAENCAIFIMLNERYLARLIVEFEEYFTRLYGVDVRKAKLVSNKAPMTRMDYIAEFKVGKTKFNNLGDAFSTYIIASKDRQRSQYHSHQKNIELPYIFITHFSDMEDVILDLFGGSGSTLIACEQLNRTCYMMELDPHYCDIIIQRWQEYTGEQAEKIS